MKKLLIPVIIAVLAGVGGGSGFSYMRVSKAYVADSLRRVDSLKANPPAPHDSTDAGEDEHAGADAHATADSMPLEEALPMTPADSIRALAASRAPLRTATKNVPNSDSHAPTTGAGSDHAAPPKGAKDEGDHATSPAKPPKGTDDHATPTKAGKASTTDAANAVRDARNDAMTTALPEQRLAKIFSAMSAKDAAKVMEQMPDGDVRSILSMMSDRSAAAVLSQFSATRAAAITKGTSPSGGGKP